jgi:rhodanese-related sulfurtransferase
MGFLDFIFGAKKRQVQAFINNNAIILDVRTDKEYNNGHIKDSLHIPLSDLHTNLEKLKAYNKPFIVCCQSGVRSAKAAKFLNLNNIEATNGGGWVSLKGKL